MAQGWHTRRRGVLHESDNHVGLKNTPDDGGTDEVGKTKRGCFSAEFKAQVALEALRGVATPKGIDQPLRGSSEPDRPMKAPGQRGAEGPSPGNER